MILTNTFYSLSADKAITEIKRVLRECRFETVERKVLWTRLLNTIGTAHNSLDIPPEAIVKVINSLHFGKYLKLDYNKLEEDWRKSFENEVKKQPNKENKEKNVLNVYSSAQFLLRAEARKYGGLTRFFGPNQILRLLRSHSISRGEQINVDGYCKAAGQMVRRLTEPNFKLALPDIIGPIK